ncbi:Ulvan-active sulfatase [Paenibacillus solanacearum]|uniref:Ulvan-active sulfatase n=1 Tax=Paenibacillus solanacearum TaxID=2048548 RepID=A0A916K9F0_9BACL|nr:sulfatase-like hydrolase/transferase [Paenibacillus solanacearum]CAG7648007.1 Ulvan-active sulfatase [Paenibacillus solanacearum]
MKHSKGKQPNVIVFFTDQQRWDTTGVHGNPLELTPNFDELAREGTDVHYSFTCQPVCGPARSILQTGVYPTTSGCYRNKIPLHGDARTLAHYFNEAGYETGYIGKWHLADAGSQAVAEPQRGGYRYWLGANSLELCSDSYNAIVYDNDGREVKLPGYRVDALTDAAIRYVDGHKEKPFFLFISYLEPHHQNHIDDYPPPHGYRKRYEGRWTPPDLQALGGSSAQHLEGYYGMVKRLDEALGRLLDTLRSLGLADDTIVLFTSDHGCHFQTRNDEYKRSCHESSIRVPTALIGPGFTGKGRVSELVSLIDLPPTLLDAAGIPVPEHMQGSSIMPLLRGERDDWPDDVFIQISESQVGRAIRTARWKYGVTAPDKDGYGHTGSDRYVEQYLYDLQADPHELTNLIGLEAYEGVAQVQGERLARRMTEAGEAAPDIVRAPRRPAAGLTLRFRSAQPEEAFE